MIMKPFIYIAALCVLAFTAGALLAAENQPLLAKPGKLLFEDDFLRPEMKPKWNVGKGTWAVKEQGWPRRRRFPRIITRRMPTSRRILITRTRWSNFFLPF